MNYHYNFIHLPICQLLLFFFIMTSLVQNMQAQDDKTAYQNNFKELNAGFAFIEDFGIPIPGVSFTWGRTIINSKNTIFEYQGGVALPTLFTAKVGIGKKIGDANFILGLRPFPLFIYAQGSFLHKEEGYWIFSVEFSPLRDDAELNVFDVRSIVNVGYRWN